MLLFTAPLSSIDSVYLSSDGEVTGDGAAVEWVDWWRMKKVVTASYAYDGTPYVSRQGVGAKGPITLVVPSCPAEIWTGITALLVSGDHVTATLEHPQLGEKEYDVVVQSLVAAGDGQYIAGDPIEGVTIRLLSFGIAP